MHFLKKIGPSYLPAMAPQAYYKRWSVYLIGGRGDHRGRGQHRRPPCPKSAETQPGGSGTTLPCRDHLLGGLKERTMAAVELGIWGIPDKGGRSPVNNPLRGFSNGF